MVRMVFHQVKAVGGVGRLSSATEGGIRDPAAAGPREG